MLIPRPPTRPTFAGALAVVRADPQAKFAALLAGVFAFSFGFAIAENARTREG